MQEDSADLQALSRSINEILVLGILRDGEKHGYQIALDVADASVGLFELRHGTLYPILHRLEGRGWIEGRWDGGAGRTKKVYRLTSEGRRHLHGEADRFEALARGILHIVRGPGRAAL
jgi:DNA-binding PadR family transcriptional regulator